MAAAMEAAPPVADTSGAPDKLPSLDGLRAFSIALVVIEHAHQTHGFPLIPFPTLLGDYGRLGVTIFFVISGFLITSLLLRERELTGRIAMGRFYARRALRIFPAFLAFMAAIIVAHWLDWVVLHRYDLLTAFTYTVNYHADRSITIGHLWSLSVEEQFYLLWPLALVGLGTRRAATFAAVMFLAAPLVRMIMRFTAGAYEDLEIFPAVADGLAIGCLMAVARPWLLRRAWYLRWSRPLPVLAALPIVALHNRFLGYGIVDLAGGPAALLVLGVLVEASTRWTGTLAGSLLNARPVVYLGLLSYSLYLWQQPFLDRRSEGWATAFPQNVLLALVCGMLSYHLLERPLLNLRRRLAGTARTAAAGAAAPLAAQSSTTNT